MFGLTRHPTRRDTARVIVSIVAVVFVTAIFGAGVQTSQAVSGGVDMQSNEARVQVLARIITREGAPIVGAEFALALAPAQRAMSGEDGQVVLPVDAALMWRLGSGGSISSGAAFRVRAAGHSTAVVRREPYPRRATLHLGDIFLRPGGVVRGRVLDPEARGIAGALVVYGGLMRPRERDDRTRLQCPPELMEHSYAELPFTHTDAEGRFVLDGVPVGHGLAWARTEQSPWTPSAPVGNQAGAVVEGVALVVEEDPDAVITGRVLSHIGAPIPGLRIFSGPTETSGQHAGFSTDASGRFHRRGRLGPFWALPRPGRPRSTRDRLEERSRSGKPDCRNRTRPWRVQAARSALNAARTRSEFPTGLDADPCA